MGSLFSQQSVDSELSEETGFAPCPFCGSSRILKGWRWFAICVDCGATGPEQKDKDWKIDWNSRIDLTSQKGSGNV